MIRRPGNFANSSARSRPTEAMPALMGRAPFQESFVPSPVSPLSLALSLPGLRVGMRVRPWHKMVLGRGNRSRDYPEISAPGDNIMVFAPPLLPSCLFALAGMLLLPQSTLAQLDNPAPKADPDLNRAIRQQNIRQVEALLTQGANPNSMDHRGE